MEDDGAGAVLAVEAGAEGEDGRDAVVPTVDGAGEREGARVTDVLGASTLLVTFFTTPRFLSQK